MDFFLLFLRVLLAARAAEVRKTLRLIPSEAYILRKMLLKKIVFFVFFMVFIVFFYCFYSVSIVFFKCFFCFLSVFSVFSVF